MEAPSSVLHCSFHLQLSSDRLKPPFCFPLSSNLQQPISLQNSIAYNRSLALRKVLNFTPKRLFLEPIPTMAAAFPKSTALASAKAENKMTLPAEMTSLPAALSLSVRGNAGLPQFRGLRIQQQSKRSLGLALLDSKRGSWVSRRAGEGKGVVCEAQETALDAVPSVTDAMWNSLVLNADGPVLVEFWAPWCGPCRMIHPVIGELAKQYTGRLSCFKLNTDESPSIATQYGVRSIPTIMIFNKGEKKDAVIGAIPKTSLESTIEKFL